MSQNYLRKFFWNLLAAVKSCRMVAVFLRVCRACGPSGRDLALAAAVVSASRAAAAPPDPRHPREHTSRQPGVED